MSDDHKFHKELAYNQIGATIAIAGGSILIGMGVALIAFSFSINLDALDKKGETYQFFQQFGNNTFAKGLLLFIFGIIVMFGGVISFAYLIHRQK